MSLKVLTIGAGFFAALHVEAWTRNPETHLVGLVDQDRAKADALARTDAPEAQIFSDAAQAIEATDPDIIDVATPPDSHPALIALADAAKPKAIICQKPFCGSLKLARQVVDTTASPLIVHENFRFQPWYRLIKSELDQNAIGTLYQITFRLRTGDGQGQTAYLSRQPYFQEMARFLIHETGIHYIDTFRYLMGEPDDLFADLRRLNPAIKGEDAGLVLFGFNDGRRALFDGNRLADHATENARLTMGECLVEGSEGTLELDGFGRVFKRLSGEAEGKLLSSTPDTTRFGGDCVYAFQNHVTDHFANGTPLETSARGYLRNMEIEEAVYRSAQERRRIDL